MLFRIHESKVLKLALDAFNVTNSQPITGKVEYTQQPANVVPGGWLYSDDQHRLRTPNQFPGSVLCPGNDPLRVLVSC